MTHNSLGSFLLLNNQEAPTPDLTKIPLWGLYFSAYWCGPCRKFTPFLKRHYLNWKQSKPFEIIYISNDQSTEEFEAYSSTMPWFCMPYSDRIRIGLLSSICRPTQIPTLCIFNASGKMISRNGVQELARLGDDAYEHWLTLPPQ